MIRRIFHIARREYLSYVATVGFWLSLALVPAFMAAGVVLPAVFERASPVRYVAIVADDPAFIAALDAELAEGERRRARAALAAALRLQTAPETRAAALDAFDATSGDAETALAAARAALGAEAPSGLDALRIETGKIVRVDAPAADPDALRPYLLGEALVETPDGPRPLSAIAVIRRDAAAGVSIDIWSAQLALGAVEFRQLVTRAARERMRWEALQAAGIDPAALAALDRLAPEVTELTPEREGGAARVTLADRLPFVMGAGLGVALWIVIFSVVNMLLTSTIEEKANKVFEMMLASARLPEILFGKLAGVAAVSFTLLGVWGTAGLAVFFAASRVAGGETGALFSVLADPALLIPFAGYFVAGYLMYGAIFIAIGSLCETIQEAQTLMSPMLFLLMAPMFVLPVALRDPESGLLAVLSWFPLYTPFLMMVRLPAGPPLIEVIATTAMLIATTGLVVWGASGLFRAGVVGRAGPGVLKSMIGGLFARRAR